jgi:hypothetical protein
MLPLEMFQAVTDTILFGTPEEQEQLKTSPEWKRVTEHFDRLDRQREESETH